MKPGSQVIHEIWGWGTIISIIGNTAKVQFNADEKEVYIATLKQSING